MSDATAQIRIDIVATGAEAGANRVNAALDRVGNKGRTIGAANDNLRGTFDRLGGTMGKAANDGGALSKVFDDIKNRAAGATPAVGGLVSNLGSMGGKAAIVAGVALAIGAVGAAAISAAAQTQKWMAQLETVTKSSTLAQESYAALVGFASRTPFDLGQSIEAFTKLRMLGLAATESRLTSFGNTAAAMGKSMNQMIEAVADASTGEFERLKEFGIKSKTEGDKVKFTFQGVTTSVAKNSTEITKYLEGIGNTTFGGAMAKQMDTLNGAFSNIQDNMQQMLAAIGGGALGQAVKEIAKTIANGIGLITLFMASIGNFVGSIIQGVGNVLNGLGQMWSGMGQASAATTLLDNLTFTFNLLGQGIQVVGSIVGSVLGAMGTFAGSVAEMWRSSFGELLDWMGISFESGGRSWGNSIMGVLRAVKAVVGLMPQLFAVAINDVMGMFRSLGSIVGRLLSGDLSALKDIGATITGSFNNTAKALNAAGRIAKATYGDVKGADAAIGRMFGRTTTKPKLDTGLDAKPTPGGDRKDKGASEAEKKAKAEAEFWKTLQGEVETAKLLPLAAEDHRKELELQKILGRDLVAGEKERIANLMQQARTAKFLTNALDDHNQKTRDIASLEQQLNLKRSGATEEQLTLEKKVSDFRSTALRQGVDLQSDAYKASEAQLRADEARIGLLNTQNKTLDEQLAKIKDMARSGNSYATDALRSSGSLSDRRGAARSDYDKTLSELKAALDSKDPNVKISTAAFNAGVKRAGEDFRETMAEIGTDFANKMGRVSDLLGNIGSMIGGKLGSLFSGAGDVAKSVGDFTKNQEQIRDQFSKVFGENSPAIKGIGKAVGGAVAGMQIGEQIAGLGKALGVKTSKQGGQIGGAIGGAAFGPIGAAVGGTLGSLIGGLFKKTPKGSAIITSGTSAQISGNKGSVRNALTGTSSSVQGGLQALAQQLGGDLGSFMVSIGKYKDSYRVSSSGASNVDTKKTKKISGLIYDGKDEAAAVAAAIQDAILDGAITGLSDLMNKALKTYAGNVDKAVDVALKMKSYEDDLKALTDPLRAAVDAITGPLDALKQTMLSVGATSADMARFEDYRSKKLAAALKEQVSGFQSILDDLNGSGGGVTALTQLTNNLAKLDTFKADLAAGKTVDQDAFTALAQSIMGNANDVYGTNSADFQAIVESLKGATTGAITNATSAFNSAADGVTNQAIADQTNAITAQQGVANDYLRQIAEAVQNSGGSYYGGYTSSMGVYNGRLIQAF
ncbi:hypothetical protein [Sphingomonas sp. Leaf242]|uniref:hypothetical protein n=1 Tax=Sphingomonas sp. Leaf242 TaxID=1736304 RepID=UPI0007139C11|nr:hypothetical protein [Sphingomonas sp. Leaf242]KQO09440.1 hypothetical protein ASF09_07390 [Sphingomonas sp. Leaf242]